MKIICVGIRKFITDSVAKIEHHFEDDEDKIIRELNENREQRILELGKNREQYGECKQCGGKFPKPDYDKPLCPVCLNLNYDQEHPPLSPEEESAKMRKERQEESEKILEYWEKLKKEDHENEKKLKKSKRMSFSTSTKQSIILKQKSLCIICNRFSQTWDFDHIDGDRGNNNTSNCQALCPTCHALKTRGSGSTS